MAEDKSTNRAWNFKDLTGKRFGRLLVVKFHASILTAGGKRLTQWLCRCDCGSQKIVPGKHLGAIVSCGCRHDTIGLTHGMCYSKEYIAWRAAKSRCVNSRNPGYGNYGGRGIRMSAEWMASFETFYADMGPCPKGYTLDRINNDGNYEPGNCRWADYRTQLRNQRRTIIVEHEGRKIKLYDLAGLISIPYKVLANRYHAKQDLLAPYKARK